MNHVVRFSTAPVPLVDAIDTGKVVSGLPVTGVRRLHEDEARGFYAGVWESGPGAWRVDYAEDELCCVLEGACRLTDDAGAAEQFAAGDVFLIRRGFKGIWETVGSIRKAYVILT
jgi:hypothetical protein